MSAQQALTGVNVLDFGWSIVGPLATKYFSDHGATVIKVESRKRIDIARTYVPMKDNRPGIDRCGWFDMYATGKYSISLNLGTARGLELAGKLVAWADVVLESFVAGQMAKWGLDYAGASRINPALVMISLSVFGQEGPMARQSGFGRQLQGYSGFTNLKGWPGLPPPGGDSYTDFIAPWYAIVALLAALDYRRRTGQGQYIDLSQHEAGINFLTPAVLDYSANGRVAAADGNRDAFNAPHGVYRCQGEDRWCAVAVEDDAAWRALCGAIGSPEMALEVKYATAAARKANEDKIDAVIEAWTRERSAAEVMLCLQKAGVAAYAVPDGKTLFNDAQLKFRRHYLPLDHPEIGVHAYEQPGFRLSKTPAEVNRSPLFAEHNEYVYTELLGITDAEFVQLLADGVLE